MLNILRTRKNKRIAIPGEPASTKNPHMAGFTTGSLAKYLRMLLEARYTVVQVDQTTPPPSPQRRVVAVHSAATAFLDEASDAPELICLTFGRIRGVVHIGAAVLDLSTGSISISEHTSEESFSGGSIDARHGRRLFVLRGAMVREIKGTTDRFLPRSHIHASHPPHGTGS